MVIQHDERLEGTMFIGDANHILTPYEVVGANTVLKNRWDLAQQICRHPSMKAAAAFYDAISIPRFNRSFTLQNECLGFANADGWKWKAYKFGMRVEKMSQTVR